MIFGQNNVNKMAQMKGLELKINELLERAKILLKHTNSIGYKYYNGDDNSSYIVQNVKIYKLSHNALEVEELINKKFESPNSEDPLMYVKAVHKWLEDNINNLFDEFLNNERENFLLNIKIGLKDSYKKEHDKDILKKEYTYLEKINQRDNFGFVGRSGGYFAIDKSDNLENYYEVLAQDKTIENYNNLLSEVEYFEYFITLVNEAIGNLVNEAGSLDFTEYLLYIVDNLSAEFVLQVKRN